MGRLLKHAGFFAGAVIVLLVACSFVLRSLPRNNEWPALLKNNEWPTLQKNLVDLKFRQATREEVIQMLGGHRDISPGTPGAAGLNEYLRRELKHDSQNNDLLKVQEKWLKWSNGISQSTPYSRAWVFFDESNRVADFVLLRN
jgi:hypothetical protein